VSVRRPPQATGGGRRFPQDHLVLGFQRARLSTCYPQILWMCVGQPRMQQQSTPRSSSVSTENGLISTGRPYSSTGSSTGFPHLGSDGRLRRGWRWYDIGLPSDSCSGLLPAAPPALSTGGPEEIPRVSLWSSTAGMDHDRRIPSRWAGPGRNVGAKTRAAGRPWACGQRLWRRRVQGELRESVQESVQESVKENDG